MENQEVLKVKKLQDKLYKNALINSQLNSINKEERRDIILKLLKTRTQRELSDEIGIPQTTLSDWKLMKEYPKKEINLSFIYVKLLSLNPQSITDWGRLEQIKVLIDDLLRHK